MRSDVSLYSTLPVVFCLLPWNASRLAQWWGVSIRLSLVVSRTLMDFGDWKNARCFLRRCTVYEIATSERFCFFLHDASNCTFVFFGFPLYVSPCHWYGWLLTWGFVDPGFFWPFLLRLLQALQFFSLSCDSGFVPSERSQRAKKSFIDNTCQRVCASPLALTARPNIDQNHQGKKLVLLHWTNIVPFWPHEKKWKLWRGTRVPLATGYGLWCSLKHKVFSVLVPFFG